MQIILYTLLFSIWAKSESAGMKQKTGCIGERVLRRGWEKALWYVINSFKTEQNTPLHFKFWLTEHVIY